MPAQATSEQSAHEALFLENLQLLDRITASVARRSGLAGDDAAEFGSWVKLRLIENDYATVRKFRGESSFGTYLTVVVAMLGRDYRVQRFGRWRPSAAAKRQGAVAIRLEHLVVRQGYRLEQAAELMRTAGETSLSNLDLARLLGTIPVRPSLRPVEVDADAVGDLEAPTGSPDTALQQQTASAEREELESRVSTTLGSLSVEDRLIVRMRFWEGLSVADVARGLNLDQKSLYRRLDRLLALLRERLMQSGVTPARIRDLLGGGDE